MKNVDGIRHTCLSYQLCWHGQTAVQSRSATHQNKLLRMAIQTAQI